MIKLEQHPLSAAFPAMQDLDYESLSKSIEQLGLLSPIVIYEGKVIDGWHRYCACLDTGTQLKTVEYLGENPQEFVIAQNKERRHLTKSQLALSAVKVYEWLPAKRPTSSTGAGIKSVLGTDLSKSSKEIAKIAGVSESYIEKAKAVETKATDEVKQSIINGNMSLKKAEETFKPVENKEPEYTEKDMLIDQNKELSMLVENLNIKLATNNYDGVEKIEDIISELKKENKNLLIELNAVKKSRDSYMNENVQLKKQIAMQKKQIDKLK